MPKIQRLICLSLALLAIICLAAPVSAVEYEVGVEVGQWIKYGEYDVVDPGDEGSIPVWSKLEVSAVAGQKVLFFANGFYRNGTEFYYHMERSIEANTTLIIGANLTGGDKINPTEEARINRTETCTYLGVERSVNILELTSSIEGVEFSANFVYDQITGLLLEYFIEEKVDNEDFNYEYRYSYNIIDSNIFGEKPSSTPTPTPNNNQDFVVIGGAIICLVVILVVVIIVIKKKYK